MTKENDLGAIAEAMQAKLPRKTRRWGFKTYPNCFTGPEAVSWLVDRGYAKSREAAVTLGQSILEAGFIAHVKSEHGFKDKKLFYHFTSIESPDGADCTEEADSDEEEDLKSPPPKGGRKSLDPGDPAAIERYRQAAKVSNVGGRKSLEIPDMAALAKYRSK